MLPSKYGGDLHVDNLSKLITDLSSWYWWLTAVVFALLVNIASAYLKPLIDSWWGRRSETKRALNDKAQAVWMKRVQRLCDDPTLMILEAHEESRSLSTAVVMILAIGIVLWLLAWSKGVGDPFAASVLRGTLVFCEFFFMVVTLLYLNRALSSRKLFLAARRRYVDKHTTQEETSRTLTN